MAQQLTEREQNVLELMLSGYSDEAIANDLQIGKRTVQTAVRSMRRKLGGDGKGDRWWLVVARARGKLEGQRRVK